MQITRSTLAILAFLSLTLGASSAFAEMKVAVVDVQTAIGNSDEAKRLISQIQGEFKDQQTQIRKIQSDAAALLERAQKNSDVMSDEEKRKLQNDIQSKNADFEYLRNKLQKQVEERRNELFAPVDKEVQQAIEDLVREGDYDLVVPSQATLYTNPVYDITNKVTEKLNQYDAAAQKAKAKSK